MSDTTTTTRKRTITLTGRPPVTIREGEWPIIAHGYAGDDDANHPGNPPNREWARDIRVRQHADGRVLVYGIYLFTSCWQGERAADARAGVLLPAPATHAQIIDAIRTVGDELAAAEDDAAIDDRHRDSRQWRTAVRDTIADLPAEEL
jgi:hypothetical protein